jgi:hypothetical protein
MELGKCAIILCLQPARDNQCGKSQQERQPENTIVKIFGLHVVWMMLKSKIWVPVYLR